MTDFVPKWASSHMPGSLKLFTQTCTLYFSVNDVKKEKQVDHILQFMGEVGLKMYNSWSLTGKDRMDPGVVLNKFTTQIEPKTNYRLMGYLLRINQKDAESINYFTRSKLQVHQCNFRDDQESIKQMNTSLNK